MVVTKKILLRIFIFIFLFIAFIYPDTSHGTPIIPLEEEIVMVQSMIADFTVVSISNALGFDPSLPIFSYEGQILDNNEGWEGVLTGNWLGNDVTVSYEGSVDTTASTTFKSTSTGDLGFIIGGFKDTTTVNQTGDKLDFNMVIDYDRDIFGIDTFESTDPLTKEKVGGVAVISGDGKLSNNLIPVTLPFHLTLKLNQADNTFISFFDPIFPIGDYTIPVGFRNTGKFKDQVVEMSVAPVPEPGTILLLSFGLIVGFRRKFKKK